MSNRRLTTIKLDKEYLKFSAAHFTIFSETERERLHGHNFMVRAKITAPVGENGMTFSYKVFKEQLESLCIELDEFLLLPGNSPFLKLEDDGKYIKSIFQNETMTFLKSDTVVLPIRNATVEEYSNYLLQRLVLGNAHIESYEIHRIVLEVSSGPGQWGASWWDNPNFYSISE